MSIGRVHAFGIDGREAQKHLAAQFRGRRSAAMRLRSGALAAKASSNASSIF